MNPVTLVFIVFTAGVLFYFSLSFISVYAKKKKEYLVRKLCQEGAANNLIFCSQEILQNKVMGFDGLHRKIMILEKTKKTYQCSTISLDEVHDCHLVTGEDAAAHSKPRGKSQQARLELQFEFNNHSTPVIIIFSNGIFNSESEFLFLKAKAEFWCIMFSKMLNRQAELRA